MNRSMEKAMEKVTGIKYKKIISSNDLFSDDQLDEILKDLENDEERVDNDQ